ncbi:uncharacterized protein LOC135704994 [Ochlerotatus camptorhynchus]|uniref:uncharacterized protein LOC135704994 n=1 Tax=Ochlerotatus camptorhynchus TaxID=644619 RepID=UPI0031CF7E02
MSMNGDWMKPEDNYEIPFNYHSNPRAEKLKKYSHSKRIAQAIKMEKFNLFNIKFGALTLLLLVLGQIGSSSPLHEAEDPITVATIQFHSKTDQDLCTGYQLNGKMFIALARCLGSDSSQINQLHELDVIGQGQQNVQAFALQAAGSDSAGDLAVIMYNGAVQDAFDMPRDSEAGLFQKFGLRSLVRIGRRQEPPAGENGNGGNATDSAPFVGTSSQLLGATLTLVGSVLLMH